MTDLINELRAQLANATAERDALAHYAGAQMLRSDYRTADEMRAALDALKSTLEAVQATHYALSNARAQAEVERDENARGWSAVRACLERVVVERDAALALAAKLP